MGVVLSLVLVRQAMAAYLILTRIGTLSTAGLNYSTWSYTGPAPDFAGTATPSATVAITVNALSATTSAALTGAWTYKPTNLVSGSNSVSIASGNEVISFMLNFTPGAVTPVPTATPVVIPTATPSALLKTGVGEVSLLVIGMGVVVFLGGVGLRSRWLESWEE